MTDIIQLIEWAFGGFWRFCGFALLLSIVSGGVARLLASLAVAVRRTSER